MEIAEGALAMAAKHKINTKIKQAQKKTIPPHRLLHSRTRYGARHIAAGTFSYPRKLNRA